MNNLNKTMGQNNTDYFNNTDYLNKTMGQNNTDYLNKIIGQNGSVLNNFNKMQQSKIQEMTRPGLFDNTINNNNNNEVYLANMMIAKLDIRLKKIEEENEALKFLLKEFIKKGE